ncbi:endo-1,4-beta-xylanase [Pedobacter ginsengisoli]|uniref:endo-1,4-beta-xylanase n=1 Tax=Pedobacter ginsengisoli TaxID=363852 RepID=UPI00254A370D|nr:endo-1,4-beta-xylanase [Pedobacter ginsengisoli]
MRLTVNIKNHLITLLAAWPHPPRRRSLQLGRGRCNCSFRTGKWAKSTGHNLCWHTQAPKWMFINQDGSQVTKEILLKRLKDHIYTVVRRYKGKVYAWV